MVGKLQFTPPYVAKSIMLVKLVVQHFIQGKGIWYFHFQSSGGPQGGTKEHRGFVESGRQLSPPLGGCKRQYFST